jgi:hypothetical protein
MTTFDLARDPRCARPTDLDRLLNDLHRVRAAVEACHQWRPRLDDWRERLADAASVDGNIVPEAQDEAELVSGMDRVQQVALALCTALDATFGIGGLEAVDDEFPLYPSHYRNRNDATNM